MRTIPVFLAAILLAAASPLSGQDERPDTVPVQEVRLVDGSILYGAVLDDGDPLRLRLLSGDVLEVSRSRVASVAEARGRVVDGEFWREDPNKTRLFFGPTARGMEKGTGYVAGYMVFMPFLGFAVTDDLILAGGTPFWGGFDNRPYWFAPKLRVVDRANQDVALGALIFGVEDESAGILYGVSTWGSPDQSVSLGLGFGFVNDDLSEKPAVMGGFEIRAGRSVKLISENYVFPGGMGLLSVGPRFFGDRLSADLGLGVLFDSDGESLSFPILNFVYVW